MKLLIVCLLAGTAMADAPPARNAAMTQENLVKFEKACDAGSAPACFDAGMRILSPTKDGGAAMVWLEKGCKRDDADSCGMVASLLGSGKYGVAKDAKRAFAIHNKLCPKVASDCRLIASYYKDGEIVPKDQKKVLQFLKLACDGGDKQGCDALASETGH
jgi:uncharacterized protein